MPPKAYRWCAQTDAVAEFVGDLPEGGAWTAFSAYYGRIAAEEESGEGEPALLRAFEVDRRKRVRIAISSAASAEFSLLLLNGTVLSGGTKSMMVHQNFIGGRVDRRP